jgi:hypothetical protein
MEFHSVQAPESPSAHSNPQRSAPKTASPLFYARNGYTTLPSVQIPSDALTLLVDRVKIAGGTVTDNTSGTEDGDR